MPQIPIDAVTSLIAAAAAEEIKPRFGCLDANDIREKGPNDLVTIADLAMEARLTPALAALLPGSLVVGEEAAALDASVLDRLLEDRPVWVIDPVDGTGNFVRNRPAVAVIVALAMGGETVGGWIHDPLTGLTATAQAGAGAWCQGVRLSVTAPAHLADAIISLNDDRFPQPTRRRVRGLRSSIADAKSLFCAGQDYLRLAQGAAHGALFWHLKPWDHAAGILLHREAGGYAAKLDGSPYKPTCRTGGLLAMPNQELWQEIRVLIGDVARAP